LGIDRTPNQNREGISGSIDGVNTTLVRNAGDLFYSTGDEFTGADWIIYQLTVGVIYLIAGKATLNWPTTCASHPSGKVQVARTATKPFLEVHEAVFPFNVESNLWHGAIVPVLEDMSINLGTPLNKCVLDINMETYLHTVSGTIANSLRTYGFIP